MTMKRKAFLSAGLCAGGCAALWKPSRADTTLVTPGTTAVGCGSSSICVDAAAQQAAGIRILALAPTAGPRNPPSSCADDAAAKVRSWLDQDQSTAAALQNRFCSYELNWVEVYPGICSCGGPPPVCPLTTHWYKDSSKAQQQRDDYIRSIYDPRRKDLEDSICACWTSAMSALSGGSQFDPQAIPGLFARPVDRFMHLYEKFSYYKGVLDTAVGNGSLTGALAVLTIFVPGLQEFSLAPIAAGIDIVTQAFQTTSIGYSVFSYQSATSALTTAADATRALFAEGARSRAGDPTARSLAWINSDLSNAKITLAGALATYNTAYDGMTADRVPPFSYCQAGADQHKALMNDMASPMLTLQV